MNRCAAAGCNNRARYRFCGGHRKELNRHDGPIALLCTVLNGTPRLEGAACLGTRYHDAETPADVRQALEICGTCPALDPCRRWIDSMNRQQRAVLMGTVVGGTHLTPRPRKELQPCASPTPPSI